MDRKQFIYVLKLIPELLIEENWREYENNIVKDHYEKLLELKNKGKVILAGKTDNLNEKSFGIVMLEVNSKDEALSIMENDPAVKKGIMVAELFPYKVAVMRED